MMQHVKHSMGQSNMQDIASAKTEAAASALPFSFNASALSVQNETKQNFSNVLLRQTESLRVFQQPREPVRPIIDRANTNTQAIRDDRRQENLVAQQSANDQGKLSQQRAQRDKRDSHVDIPKAHQNRSTNTQPHESASASVNTSNTVKSDYQDGSSLASANQVEHNTQKQERPSSFSEDRAMISTSKNDNEQEIIDDETASIKAVSNDVSKPDDFDYIDYVTKLAGFTGNDVNADKVHSDKHTSDALIEDNFIDVDNALASFVSDKISKDDDSTFDQQGMNITPLIVQSDQTLDIFLSAQTLDATAAGSAKNETVKLTIAANDLLTLIDAQQQIQDSNTHLSQAQQTDVNNIIEDLAKQLEAVNTPSNAPSSSSSLEADKALLQVLLMAKPDTLPQATPAANDEAVQLDPKSAAVNHENINNKVPNLTAEILGATVNEANTKTAGMGIGSDAPIDLSVKNEQQPAIETQVIGKGKLANSDAALLNANEQAGAKLSGDIKKSDTSTSPLMNLAQLSDHEAKAALENLSQRLQSASAQLSQVGSEHKGNEFIAALQSGLKEFKQQLAQAREPAIDLKAMVADALAQVSATSSSEQQPKIDAAVNKFTSALNLASSINASAMLSQTQAQGIIDSQLAKEINFSHVEGMKLANGVGGAQNQLNLHASADKAINIFKQEGQQQLVEKVRWMVNAKNATAEIRLDPPDLGGINIKINLSGDTAQVSFNVQSSAAKEALDHNAPRLREMLQEQGIELGQSSVQQDSQSNQQSHAQDEKESFAVSDNMHNADELQGEQGNVLQGMHEQRIANGAIGGIDFYA
jgi:flagellar hook-length control protein FliK